MNYYLITKDAGYSICLVKNNDRKAFVRQCGRNILLCSSRILDLFAIIGASPTGHFSFSDN